MAKTMPTKRLLLVLGGKGGVGKTFLCRVLFFFFCHSKCPFAAFDADRENPEFHHLHAQSEPTVQPFNFLDVAKTKLFISFLEENQPSTVLVDMPAASSHGMREQFQRFDLLNAVMDDALGYRITVIGMLNHNYHAIASLAEMMEEFGDLADYVVILSDMWKMDGHDYELWFESEERLLFQSLNGVEVPMPLLELSSFHELHKRNLPFSETHSLGFGDRIIIRGFLNRTRGLFEPAASYLALPDIKQWQPVTFERKKSKRSTQTRSSKSGTSKSGPSKAGVSKSASAKVSIAQPTSNAAEATKAGQPDAIQEQNV